MNTIDTTAVAVAPHRALQHLTIQGMDWKEAGHSKAHSLARYLDRLFPKLERVDGPKSQAQVWNEVESIVLMCQTIREEARQ
jgi:hypothetical protein